MGGHPGIGEHHRHAVRPVATVGILVELYGHQVVGGGEEPLVSRRGGLAGAGLGHAEPAIDDGGGKVAAAASHHPVVAEGAGGEVVAETGERRSDDILIDTGLRIHAQIAGCDPPIDGCVVIHGQLVIRIEITVKLGAVVEHHVVVVNPNQASLIVGIDIYGINEFDVLIDKYPGQARPGQLDGPIINRQLIDIIIPLAELQGRIVTHRQSLQLVLTAAGERQDAILGSDGTIAREGHCLLPGLASQRVGGTDGWEVIVTG
ncbi:hypothetical protein D3C72_658490 [compost metagenome]